MGEDTEFRALCKCGKLKAEVIRQKKGHSFRTGLSLELNHEQFLGGGTVSILACRYRKGSGVTG